MKEDNRQSIAQYPTLDGEADDLDMSDAIPYWTQPKIVGGNWDDVRQLSLAPHRVCGHFLSMSPLCFDFT